MGANFSAITAIVQLPMVNYQSVKCARRSYKKFAIIAHGMHGAANLD